MPNPTPSGVSESVESAALISVLVERHEQRSQWGDAHNDHLLVAEWRVFIEERCEKLRRDDGNARDRFVTIGALALAAIEAYDRAALSGRFKEVTDD